MKNDINYTIEDIDKVAKEKFGIDSLRPIQREVISKIVYSISSSKQSRNFVILPTGAGKTVCFMLPSFLIEGVTIIVYPLLSLIADQKRRLDEAGIKSLVFSGGKKEEEWKEMWQGLESGIKIILTNPETLHLPFVLEKLKNVDISHFVIDEAHCIVEWGESFRPTYLALGSIIKNLNPVCVSAFTATASERILGEMRRLLFESESAGDVIRSDGDRKNIFYGVVKTYSKIRALKELVRSEKKPMLIFCGTRFNSEEIAKTLADYLEDFSEKDTVRFYHAGLTKREKKVIEEWFYKSKDGILCATCAYGMGVDKSDIRTVIHAELSPSIESYMQESGRVGRDGKAARAILLYNSNDLEKKNLIVDYIQLKTCRRNFLLKEMGEKKEVECCSCDICTNSVCDIVDESKEILSMVKKHTKYFDAEMITDFFCKNRQWTADEVKDVLELLEREKKIKKCGILWEHRLKFLSD